MRFALCIGLLLIGLTCHLACADAPKKSMPARAHLDRGLQLFDLQRYDDSIAEFNAGYEAEPLPDFLYAIGQAERGAGRCKRAIDAYKSYLRSSPGVKQTKLAQYNIERCEEQLAREAVQPSELLPIVDGLLPPDAVLAIDERPLDAAAIHAPVALTPGQHVVTLSAPGRTTQRVVVQLGPRERREVHIAFPPLALDFPSEMARAERPRSRAVRIAPWLIFGTGLAMAASGAIVLGVAASHFDQLKTDCGTLCERSEWTRWQAAATASYVLLAAGGAAAAGGLAWRFAVAKKRVSVTPTGPTGLAVVFE